MKTYKRPKSQDELDSFLRSLYLSNFRNGFPKSIIIRDITPSELREAEIRIGNATNTWLEVYYKPIVSGTEVYFVPGRLVKVAERK